MVRVGLAGKSRQHVGRQRELGHGRAQAADDAAEVVDRVAAAHPLEHDIGAGLQRQVDVLADLRLVRDRGDDVVGEVDRVGRREADALDAVDAAHRAEQLREADVLEHVRVDRLAEQHDLAIAGLGELADLAQHLARRRPALAAARERHHAERAELVAAALDRDEAADAVNAGRARQALVGLGLVEVDVDHPSGARGLEHRGHPAIRVPRPAMTSTAGARSARPSLRCSAMQPTIASTMPGRLRLSAPSSVARAITRSSAFSRTAHVLITMTSASSARAAVR